LGARRCEGTGRGESPDAKEEMAAGTPGGDSGGGGGGVLRSTSRPRGVAPSETREGSGARCLEAGPSSTGKLGLPGPKKPHAQGFQKRMMGFTWKNSGRAADAGNRRVPSGDLGFQTRP